MQILQDENQISRHDHQRRKNFNGPCQTWRNKRLANPHHSETSVIFSGIWKLLQKVHFSLLWSCSTPQWPDKERQEIWMDHWMSRSIWHLETMIHWRTSIIDAWSVETIPNQIRCIKSGNRSCTHSIGFEWRLTPCSVHVKNIHGYWKIIWDIWQGTFWNHWALKEWRHYIQGSGHTTIVFSDHKNLTYFRTAQKLNDRQARWSLYLSEFNIKLIHLPGSKMIQSDALSWWPDHGIEGQLEEEEMIMLPENMFINLLDTDLQERKELYIDVKNAMEILLQEGPTSLKNDLEDWKIEEVDGKRIIFYKGKN